MQIVFVQFIILAAFSSVAFCQTQQSPPVLLQGRFLPGSQQGSATLPQTISWTGSSIYVAFQGASFVNISITASPTTNVSYSINWLRFYIDEEVVGDGFTSYKKLALNVAFPVSTQIHTLRIAKLSDPSKGEATVNSIQLDRGSFLQPSVSGLASNRRILILGDSYSVGYGDAGASIPNTCNSTLSNLPSNLTQLCNATGIPLDEECANYVQVMNGNSLAAYGPLTANAFNADYQILASSGTGMVGFSYGFDAHPNWTLAEIQSILPSNQMVYNRTIFSSSIPTYDVSTWMPQVVIIGSGTNDWHSLPPEYSLQNWTQQAVSFLQQINTTLNKPVIVVLFWSKAQQTADADSPEDYELASQYFKAMPTFVGEANKAGLDNVHLLQLRNVSDADTWCQGHPSAVSQARIARQIVGGISDLLPSWTVTNPVNLTVDQVAIRPNLALLNSGGIAAKLPSSSISPQPGKNVTNAG